MRLEAEVRPDGTVLGGLRRPPISRLPPLDRYGSLLRAPPAPLGLTSVEDHGDARIGPKALAQLPAEFRAIAADDNEPSAQSLPDCPCALMTLPGAGRGPGGGTRMALMDPSSITVLAIVVVAGGRRRDGLLLGRGFRETLPQHVPVPGDAAEPQPPEADRPATPEWIAHEESPRLVQGGSGPTGSPSSHPPVSAERVRQVERLRGFFVLPLAFRLFRDFGVGRGGVVVFRTSSTTSCHQCSAGTLSRPSSRWRVSAKVGS
jgi:hypothetical protein